MLQIAILSFFTHKHFYILRTDRQSVFYSNFSSFFLLAVIKVNINTSISCIAYVCKFVAEFPLSMRNMANSIQTHTHHSHISLYWYFPIWPCCLWCFSTCLFLLFLLLCKVLSTFVIILCMCVWVNICGCILYTLAVTFTLFEYNKKRIMSRKTICIS